MVSTKKLDLDIILIIMLVVSTVLWFIMTEGKVLIDWWLNSHTYRYVEVLRRFYENIETRRYKEKSYVSKAVKLIVKFLSLTLPPLHLGCYTICTIIKKCKTCG